MRVGGCGGVVGAFKRAGTCPVLTPGRLRPALSQINAADGTPAAPPADARLHEPPSSTRSPPFTHPVKRISQSLEGVNR